MIRSPERSHRGHRLKVAGVHHIASAQVLTLVKEANSLECNNERKEVRARRNGTRRKRVKRRARFPAYPADARNEPRPIHGYDYQMLRDLDHIPSSSALALNLKIGSGAFLRFPRGSEPVASRNGVAPRDDLERCLIARQERGAWSASGRRSGTTTAEIIIPLNDVADATRMMRVDTRA